MVKCAKNRYCAGLSGRQKEKGGKKDRKKIIICDAANSLFVNYYLNMP